MASEPARLRLIASGEAARASAAGGPFPHLSDAQLVALTADDDVGAFETLYRRHAPFALNLAVRLQGNATDVEDIVHDAFLRARTRLLDLREASAFRAWLGSIVVRLVRSRLRRRRLLVTLGLVNTGEPVDLDTVASPDVGPESRALLAQVYALLVTMRSDDRIAWTLRYVERHRLEAVAELAGCSLATAKRRISRAQRFLSGHFVSPLRESSLSEVAP
jgi:RNA polymerase sigma-70 factor (ECF subfamily)